MWKEMPIVRQRLIVEGYGCRENVSVEDVYNFMIHITRVLQMRILVPPVVVRVPVENPVEGIATLDTGVSGTLIWLESGLHVHEWRQYGFVAVDLFSCKLFKVSCAEKAFKEWFDPERIVIFEPKLPHLVPEASRTA